MGSGPQDVTTKEALEFLEGLWVRLSDNLIDTNPPGKQAAKMTRRLRIIEAIYLELDQ